MHSINGYAGRAALAIGLLAPLAAGQFCLPRSLATLFASNNGGAAGGAVYFDLKVDPAGICAITAFDINTDALGGVVRIDVWVARGSAAGKQTNPAVWSQVASGSGVGAGRDNPTRIDTGDFGLGVGDWGMAIVCDTGHLYTAGNGQNQVYGDGFIDIALGSASNAPFSAPLFEPRVWNGRIHYTVGVECLLVVGLQKASLTVGGDTLLVTPLAHVPMTLTNLPVLDVPGNPGLVGMSVYVQALLFNPQVYPADPLKASHGLDYRIGVGTGAYGTGSGLGLWNIGAPIVHPGGRIEIDFSIPGS